MFHSVLIISEVFFHVGKLMFNVGQVAHPSSFLQCGGVTRKCRNVFHHSTNIIQLLLMLMIILLLRYDLIPKRLHI